MLRKCQAMNWTYINRFRINYFWVNKQFPCLCVAPIFWYFVLGFINVLKDHFDAFVLRNQWQGALWSNAPDSVTIVTTEQYAEVDELEMNSAFY